MREGRDLGDFVARETGRRTSDSKGLGRSGAYRNNGLSGCRSGGCRRRIQVGPSG